MRVIRPVALSFLSLSLVLGLAPVAGIAAAAEPDPACEATGEAADVLERVKSLQGECGMSPPCVGQMLEILEAALDRHPNDLHLRREIQSLWHHGELPEARKPEREATLERFRGLAEAHPDDAESVYLAARAMDDPEAARALYLEALEVDPSFPWAHLGVLATYLQTGAPAGEELERRHLAGFLDRCPALVWSAGAYSRALKNDPFWRERVAVGRAALLERGLAEEYMDLGRSWRTLYESTPLAEQAAIEPVVREEIAAVEALGLEDEMRWWIVLDSGYELVGDSEAQERLVAARTARFPCSEEAAQDRQSAWAEEHPKPEESEGDEAERRWANLFWRQASAWLEECPDRDQYRLFQLQAANAGAEISDAQAGELADSLLAAVGRGQLFLGMAMETMVAQMLVQQEAQLDRVDALAAAGREKDEERLREALDNPRYPDDLKERLAENLPQFRWQELLLRARAATARGDTDVAREHLATMASWMDERRPADDAPDAERQRHLIFEGGYLALSGALASAEERHADAAVLYARASTLQADPEEALEKGWQAWSAAGGSAEGWQSLADGLAGSGSGSGIDRTAMRWKEMDQALPADFEVDALSGESWARADFEGKTVFVNLWATWCGPCRKELPEVEKLYELTRERDDVRVVTFNIDANPGAALRYAEEEGFTFPVLLAGDLVNEMGGVSGIPRSWIVDSSATVRREQLGFGEAEGWIDEVMELLERYSEEGTD
jgi:thiol-disulfide isomerase/thioredoxin